MNQILLVIQKMKEKKNDHFLFGQLNYNKLYKITLDYVFSLDIISDNELLGT